MIRTHTIPCDLPRPVADALNRASGAIYTQTLITHYRVYRKRGQRKRHWLSQFAAMRLNDYLTRDEPPLLHAHSRDAAQEGFYKACKTARANRALGAHQNQKLSTWRHGKLRAKLTYKAEAEGMAVVLVDERHTSQTCPNCSRRYKPKGRTYRCPDCRFQAHRDIVGAANILSRQLYGDVGKSRPPPATMYRHPVRPGKRSGLDTGQPKAAVACG